jgi:hypothetical protein
VKRSSNSGKHKRGGKFPTYSRTLNETSDTGGESVWRSDWFISAKQSRSAFSAIVDYRAVIP